MAEELVWYAAYGSNIDAARFITYLTGGPVPGTDDAHEGSRDRSAPRAEAPFVFSRSIRFAHHSQRWNGATAVLDHQPSDAGALGRRYLITRPQFFDLVAQENHRPAADIPIDDLVMDEVHPFSSHRYDGILLVGSDDGTPIATFTSPSGPEQLPAATPSSAYLGTMARGIQDAHSLTAHQVAHHLRRAPGTAPTWSVADIADLMK